MAIGGKMSASFQHRTPPPPSAPQQLKSQSIPISGAHRTASEVQLCEDEALADYRDYVVFSRIVNHHRERQQQYTKDPPQVHRRPYYQRENDKCLEHVLKTRNSLVGQAHQEQEPHQDTLQSLSHHIAQAQTAGEMPSLSLASDDYYCGEEAPPTTSGGWILSSTADLVEDVLALDSGEEKDEGIFALEL